jgi:outer membrane protein assembly factor BamB
MSYRSEPQQAPPIVVVAFAGRVFGLDAMTGARVWQSEHRAGAGHVRLAMGQTRVYALRAGELSCLDYATGRALWSTALPFSADTLLLEGAQLFAGGSGEACRVSEDGAVVWHDSFSGMGQGNVALGVPGSAAQPDQTT